MFELLKVSWQESIGYLSLSKLAPLFLVSLRTLITVYRSLLFAWVMPTALLIGALVAFIGLTSGWGLVAWHGFLLIGSFFIVLIIRAARPSIERKHSEYWLNFEVADWALFGSLWLLFASTRFLASYAYQGFAWALLIVSDALLKILLLKGQTWLPGSEQLGTFIIFLSPFVILWTLFMLDARQSVWYYFKAFVRALAMMLYNYPFFFLSYEIVRLVLAALSLVSGYFNTSATVSLVAWVFFYAVFFPYYICVITNFYVKRLHDQFGLYYKS